MARAKYIYAVYSGDSDDPDALFTVKHEAVNYINAHGTPDYELWRWYDGGFWGVGDIIPAPEPVAF